MQRDPSVTPLTGNAVLTTQSITLIVAVVVYLARTKGYEIDESGQNLLIQFLTEPATSETNAGAPRDAMPMPARLRVYSELSVKDLTGRERPPV